MTDGLILLVGDDHDTLPVLQAEGYQIFRAETGFEALGLLTELEPDLILLDFDLPGLGSLDMLGALKSDPDTSRIGVLVLGDVSQDLSRAFAAGADEFLVARLADPVADHELVARAGHLIERKRATDQLYYQAHYDALTGVLNRGSFMERLERQIMRLARDGRPLCLIMIDLDHCKAINDTQGHLAGDGVLRQVAELLRRNVRATDMVGRYGGDEFVLALPEASLLGGVSCASRLRTRLDDARLGTTASFGVAQTRREVDAQGLVTRADGALYHAKQAGRDLVAYEHDGLLALDNHRQA